MPKTNAMRVLDARGIAYHPAAYPPQFHSGEDVAHAIGAPVDQVFKTLVVAAEGGTFLLAVIPSGRELDLKRTASAAGVKRVRMATRKEAEGKTGLLAGGISALALLGKSFAVYLDRHALDYDAIWVSAGQRGYNLRIAVHDFVAVTRAEVAELATEPAS